MFVARYLKQDTHSIRNNINTITSSNKCDEGDEGGDCVQKAGFDDDSHNFSQGTGLS